MNPEDPNTSSKFPNEESDSDTELDSHYSFDIPTLDFSPNPDLAKKGWERRFMADPDRAKEATQIYSEMGYEVRIEAINPSELSLICGDCREVTCKTYVTIYTRKSAL